MVYRCNDDDIFRNGNQLSQFDIKFTRVIKSMFLAKARHKNCVEKDLSFLLYLWEHQTMKIYYYRIIKNNTI